MNYYNRRIRLIKAEEQAQLAPVPLEEIIGYINGVLKSLKIPVTDNPRVELSPDTSNNIDYEKIQIENGLENKNDILWVKFTKDGYLGVVTTGATVNFEVPPSADLYNARYTENWLYNTAAIITHHLDKKWDTSFVLIFPLKNMPSSYYAVDVEQVVENHLIDKNVPILDFYHNIRI